MKTPNEKQVLGTWEHVSFYPFFGVPCFDPQPYRSVIEASLFIDWCFEGVLSRSCLCSFFGGHMFIMFIHFWLCSFQLSPVSSSTQTEAK